MQFCVFKNNSQYCIKEGVKNSLLYNKPIVCKSFQLLKFNIYDLQLCHTCRNCRYLARAALRAIADTESATGTHRYNIPCSPHGLSQSIILSIYS